MNEFILYSEDFKDKEFNALMHQDKGKRLWVTYCNNNYFFKVESLKTGKVIHKTNNLNDAIDFYNSMQ